MLAVSPCELAAMICNVDPLLNVTFRDSASRKVSRIRACACGSPCAAASCSASGVVVSACVAAEAVPILTGPVCCPWKPYS